MSVALLEAQWKFARLVPRLLDKAHELGYEVRGGEWYRSPEEAARQAKAGAGISRSLHTLGLAIDLCLFRDGLYLTDSTDYEPLGVAWEAMDPLCRWGGRFLGAGGKSAPDGNHFSIEYDGRK